MDIHGIEKLTLLSYLDENNPEMKNYIKYTSNRHFVNGHDSYQLMLQKDTDTLYFLHSTLVSWGGACGEKPEHVEEVQFYIAKQLLMHELNRYKSLLEEEESQKNLSRATIYHKRIKSIEDFVLYYSLVEVVKFEGFGFWIESVSTIEKLFSLMQPLVNTLTEKGYRIIEIGISGGVHELDTGYECFSGKTYASFEEAQKNLPLDFAKEQKAKLDGYCFFTLSFDTFSIKFSKGDVYYRVLFSRGALYASANITALIPVDEIKDILVNSK